MQQITRHVVIFFCIMFVVGCAAQSGSLREIAKPLSEVNTLTLEKFDEQWDIIVNEYMNELPDTLEAKLACFQKVLAKGLGSCLNDRFSRYLSKEETIETYEEIRGSYAGIGLELVDVNDSVKITSIIKNSPAEKSGTFEMGDILIEVNGKDISGQSIKTVIPHIRGSPGTEVIIRVRRKNKKLDAVALIRENIEIHSVHAVDIDEDITYVKIDYFNKLTPGELAHAMISRLLFESSPGNFFLNFGAKKFIYDLRENPGGILEAAGMMSYLFAENGDHIVITQQSRRGEDILRVRDFVADNIPIPVGIFRFVTIVLLVNEGSGSAAEIFAAFVHEATGAKRIGKKSYGKGSIQQVFPLKEEDAILLTIAEYLVGNQRVRINKIGIKPEYEIDNPESYKNDDAIGIRIDLIRDLQLKKAIEVLRQPRR